MLVKGATGEYNQEHVNVDIKNPGNWQMYATTEFVVFSEPMDTRPKGVEWHCNHSWESVKETV